MASSSPALSPPPASSSSPPPASSSSPPPASSSSAPPPSSSSLPPPSSSSPPPPSSPSVKKDPDGGEGKRSPSKKPQAFVEEDDDGLLDWNVSPEYLRHLQEKYKDENFPLFMDDDLPKNVEENAHLLALQQLAYEGETPKTVAERCRAAGNAWLQGRHEEQIEEEEKEKQREKEQDREGKEREKEKKIKRGKAYSARMALQCYTRGLEQGCEDGTLTSALLSNRAQCHLILGDLVACVDDCRKAIKTNPNNLRAYYRASRASFLLELYRQSAAFASKGLELDPTNGDFRKLRDEAEASLDARRQRRKEIEEKEKKREAEKTSKRTLSALEVLAKRDISVVASPYDFPGVMNVEEAIRVELPSKEEDGKEKENRSNEEERTTMVMQRQDSAFRPVLFFTVVLLFDEYMITETITDYDERACLEFYLRHMFPFSTKKTGTAPDEEEGEGAEVTKFVEWDREKKYTVDSLAAYYECSMPGDMLFKISLDVSLRDVLNTVKRIAGVPIFHMLVENSSAQKAFLRDAMVEILHSPDVALTAPEATLLSRRFSSSTKM